MDPSLWRRSGQKRQDDCGDFDEQGEYRNVLEEVEAEEVLMISFWVWGVAAIGVVAIIAIFCYALWVLR